MVKIIGEFSFPVLDRKTGLRSRILTKNDSDPFASSEDLIFRLILQLELTDGGASEKGWNEKTGYSSIMYDFK